MEKTSIKDTTTQTQQTSAPSQDSNLLLEELRKMNARMQEMEARQQRIQQTESIPQDSVMLYDRNTYNTNPKINREPEIDQSLTPKTIGEIREEQRNELKQQRQQFLYDQQFGAAITKDQKYGRNKINYQECAALMMYENGDEKFRAIVKDKIDLLRECKYIELAETTLGENQRAERLYRDIFSDAIPFYDEKNDILKHKVNELSTGRT